MEHSIESLWDSMGVTKESRRSSAWVEKLLWEALIGYLELCPVTFDMVIVASVK